MAAFPEYEVSIQHTKKSETTGTIRSFLLTENAQEVTHTKEQLPPIHLRNHQLDISARFRKSTSLCRQATLAHEKHHMQKNHYLAARLLFLNMKKESKKIVIKT